MAFIESPRFPDTLAFGAIGGPGWLTDVVMLRSGDEQRNQRCETMLGMWDVGQVNRSTEESKTLLAHFNAIARGQLNGFRFRDPLPGEAEGIDEPFGLGTGSSQQYQLVKWYRIAGYSVSRTITKPVVGSVTIKVNGVPTLAYSLDTTTGIVTMTAGQFEVLTASFQFDVPVRFGADHLPMARVDMQVFSWDSIVLHEDRAESGSILIPGTPGYPTLTGYYEPWEYAYSGTDEPQYTEVWNNLTNWSSHGAGAAAVSGGRLHFSFTLTGTQENVFPGVGLDHGFLQGIISSTVRSVASGVVGGSVCGLACLMNQDDMSNGSGGTGYAILLRAPQGDMILARIEDGLPNYTILATSAAGAFIDSQDVDIAIRWDASAATVAATGGVVLTAYRNGTEIPNLILVTDDAYTTTTGEAPLAHRGSGFYDAYFAGTSLQAVP